MSTSTPRPLNHRGSQTSNLFETTISQIVSFLLPATPSVRARATNHHHHHHSELFTTCSHSDPATSPIKRILLTTLEGPHWQWDASLVALEGRRSVLPPSVPIRRCHHCNLWFLNPWSSELHSVNVGKECLGRLAIRIVCAVETSFAFFQCTFLFLWFAFESTIMLINISVALCLAIHTLLWVSGDLTGWWWWWSDCDVIACDLISSYEIESDCLDVFRPPPAYSSRPTTTTASHPLWLRKVTIFELERVLHIYLHFHIVARHFIPYTVNTIKPLINYTSG